MRTDLFHYPLPEELIASRPPAARDGARLLVVDGATLHDRAVVDLPALLPPRSLVVFNDTRVIPARLLGNKPSGGHVEILLLRRTSAPGTTETWQALGRSSKPLRLGEQIDLGELLVEVLEKPAGALIVRVSTREGPVSDALERVGHMPLPPYMKRADEPQDRDRYQTVFASKDGAVAAPTAGLHFSRDLLARLEASGHERASVTLHVGLGTFRPVTADDLDAHDMHEEAYDIPTATCDAIARARREARPVVAIGTTVVRALESAVQDGDVRPGPGETRLLIQPGYRFRVVDLLFTNFHLPRSTLLALASAFGGYESTRAAYAHAVRQRYRFFSYGDAMLLAKRAGPCDAGGPR